MDKTEFYILNCLIEKLTPRTREEIQNEVTKEISAPNYHRIFCQLETLDYIKYAPTNRITPITNGTKQLHQYVITDVGKIRYREILSDIQEENLDKETKKFKHTILKQSIFGTKDWWKLAIWTGLITALFSIIVSVSISKCSSTSNLPFSKQASSINGNTK